MSEPAKVRLPGGYVVEVPREKWEAATSVVPIEGDEKLLLLLALQTTEHPEPIVHGMFVLMPPAVRQLATGLDAIRKHRPEWFQVQ